VSAFRESVVENAVLARFAALGNAFEKVAPGDRERLKPAQWP
jgi:hypothetical protein